MKVEIYTKPSCSFCTAAKQALSHYNVPYVEHRLDVNFSRQTLLEKFPTATTYPVVVVDGFFIGGYTELSEHLKKEFDTSRVYLTE